MDISIGEADHEDVAKGEVDRMIQAALNKAALRGVEGDDLWAASSKFSGFTELGWDYEGYPVEW